MYAAIYYSLGKKHVKFGLTGSAPVAAMPITSNSSSAIITFEPTFKPLFKAYPSSTNTLLKEFSDKYCPSIISFVPQEFVSTAK